MSRLSVEGSYILRLLRVVPRVRPWRLAAGEGRESRRVVAEAARSDLHTLTHTHTHLRTRISVTVGAVMSSDLDDTTVTFTNIVE